MGCDIHLGVEVYKDNESRWVNVTGDFYNGRNYELFAALADVRNRFEIKPISDPKGAPADMDKITDDTILSHEHSASYLTVAELMAYDWTQEITMSGYLNPVSYAKWNKWGRHDAPTEYCQGASGEKLSNEEMDKLVSGYTKNDFWDGIKKLDEAGLFVHTFCEWTRLLCEECTHFLGETMPKLWRLGTPDKVRIVFDFDS